MKLVLVEWLDSHSGRGWQEIGRIKEASIPLYCRSVGFLAEDGKDCKVLVPHIAGEKNEDIVLLGSGDISIPTCSIKKITVLRQ